jgi:hypothetical protein
MQVFRQKSAARFIKAAPHGLAGSANDRKPTAAESSLAAAVMAFLLPGHPSQWGNKRMAQRETKTIREMPTYEE